jgi:penicillin-binding protein 1A
MTSGKDKKTKVSRGRGLIGSIVYWLLVLCVWGSIAVVGVIVWYAYDLPDVSELDSIRRRPSVTLLAADGTAFARFGELYGEAVQVADLPPYMPRAVVAIEDRRFYSHFGLDPIGLARAAFNNLLARRIVQGGSTITQQLAKNVFLTSDRTIKRKVQELLLALWLEANFSKDQILTLYLNRVYLGAGAYGVDAAARRYFGKPAAQVNVAEAALLAGLLKAPSRYAPTRDLTAARDRAAVVLASMVDAGFITERQASEAKRRPAGLARATSIGRQYRYFADWIMDRLPDYIGRTDRDLVVRTTLDSAVQLAAERALEATLAGPGIKSDVGQGAIVALSPDGAVRAMVGGRNYADSQFNRATQARRQPGSAFKPFVYLAGLESGLNPDTRMVDKPVTVDGWSPKNYVNNFIGEVSLREALAQSINTVAVQVSERAGRSNVIDVAARLGIAGDIPRHPSIALGVAEVVPLNLAAAYVPFANGGQGVLPHGVERIDDGSGAVLYRRAGTGLGQVMSRAHAAAMTGMLQATILEGTGRAAKLDRPAAGKTGTSQDYRDAWFVGYTPDLVAAVWLGNDDARPMRHVTGGGLPARTWRQFMLAALKGKPVHDFKPAPATSENFVDRLMRSLGGGSGSAPKNGEGEWNPRRNDVSSP